MLFFVVYSNNYCRFASDGNQAVYLKPKKMNLYFLYSEKELKKELYTNSKSKYLIIDELYRRLKKSKLK